MDAERRAEYLRWLRPDDLRGASLRYALLTLLADLGPSTIKELLEQLERRGLRVGGRDPAKTVADVLRYECRKGRARRVDRGRYRALTRPDTTRRRHRARLVDLMGEAERRRSAGRGP